MEQCQRICCPQLTIIKKSGSGIDMTETSLTEFVPQERIEQFKIVFDAIRRLLAEDESPSIEIGFKA